MQGRIAARMGPVDVLQAAAGALAVAWLPGYVWSRVLLPDLSRLERGFTSVILSVALMVLGLYLGNKLLGVRIGPFQAVGLSLAITLAGIAFPLGRWLVTNVDRALGPE